MTVRHQDRRRRSGDQPLARVKETAREAMDLVYRQGGSTSFKCESRLAECWRDLHVVGQTVTIAPEWYPIGGRVYLGMEIGRAHV